MFRLHRLIVRNVQLRYKGFASISKSILDAIPQAENTDSAWSEVRQQLKHDNRRLVVLDDDPTGCQTVYDVNVLLDYSVKSIEKQLERDDKLFYILTNTRSLSESKAKSVIKQVLDNLTLAATEVTYPHELQIISRSDSTLRGHFPAETDAIKDRLAVHATIICPAFFEGGRVTLNDTHYVIEGDKLIPAGETPFAKDAHFGFSQSNLKDWVEEKTRGAVRRQDVLSISLEDLRGRDAFFVANKMEAMAGYDNVIIVNAVNQHDLNSFVLALLASERIGYRYLYRTAASFVASRAGLEPRRLLNLSSQPAINSGKRAGGLIVVGSYVPKTTAQLQVLLNTTSVCPVELSVADIFKAAQLGGEPRQGDDLSPALRDLADGVGREVAYQLYCGRDVVLYTSRGFAEGAQLVDTAVVSQVICAIVRQIALPLPFLVAKGGITSHDVAQHGLGMASALVLGQVEPGVPVWRAGPESRFPLLNYVVFPGNVGDDNALARVAMKLGVRRKVHQGDQPLFSQSSVKMISALRDAKRNGTAIAAFNIYNLEGAKAVVAAAEIMQVPVILQVHPASLEFGGRPLLELLKAFKRQASVPVFVSLDHVEREADVDMALQSGLDAVMVDGSARSFEDNLRWTAKMASWVHDSGDALVEAELGRLAGNEDGLDVDLRDSKMTDPERAGLFARETKVDLLAVTIGNVHGPYSLPPQLDFERLDAIRAAVPADMPLVLHGASGLNCDWVRGAMDRGVCKFNVNTDLREAALKVQQEAFRSQAKKVETLGLMRDVVSEMSKVATEKLQLFSCGRK